MSEHTAVLDRAQREALRNVLRTTTSGYGDFAISFRKGDRQWVTEQLERLQGMVALMDAIGWSEQPDAPDEQPVTPTSQAAWWAGIDRAELTEALAESTEVLDSDLLALGAYQAIEAQA